MNHLAKSFHQSRTGGQKFGAVLQRKFAKDFLAAGS
jgi:hypothetical protein